MSGSVADTVRAVNATFEAGRGTSAALVDEYKSWLNSAFAQLREDFFGCEWRSAAPPAGPGAGPSKLARDRAPRCRAADR